jgi:hypothetical protein
MEPYRTRLTIGQEQPSGECYLRIILLYVMIYRRCGGSNCNCISLSIIAGVDLLTSEQIRLLKLVSKMFFPCACLILFARVLYTYVGFLKTAILCLLRNKLLVHT